MESAQFILRNSETKQLKQLIHRLLCPTLLIAVFEVPQQKLKDQPFAVTYGNCHVSSDSMWHNSSLSVIPLENAGEMLLKFKIVLKCYKDTCE